ncbi:MAG TPA: MFS transporter [Gammaproteobacteria bacterium]|nr:MFS transporter [Gammaproteobacteria bacterium]
MSSITSSWKALSLQPLRWFGLNGIASNFGSGLNYITMTWILLSVNNSVSSLALLMMCFWGPTVFLGPICGVIADRYSRKGLLVMSNATRGVLLVLVALIITQHVLPWEIYATAILLSIFGNFYGPTAFAYIREIVPVRQMLHANAIVAISYELGNIAGMGCAGFLIAAFSSRIVLAISGLLFLLATWCLILIKPLSLYTEEAPDIVKPRQRRGFWFGLRGGLRYLSRRKSLRVLYYAQLLIMINFFTAPILLAPYAKNILHATASEFGLIEICLSVGVILGGLTAPLLTELWNFKILVFTQLTALTILFVLFGFTSTLWAANVIYFLMGVTLAAWTLLITKAQLHTHINFQARVQSVFNSAAAVLILLVYILLDITGDLLPLSWLYGLEAMFTAIAVLLLWRHKEIL